MRRPRLAIVAGPNGSGKTTFFENVLRDTFRNWINADMIARDLEHDNENPIGAEEFNLEAARRAEQARLAMIQERQDFAFETVFSRTDYWLSFIRTANSAGYEVTLFFICTESAIINVERVRARVGAGGHDVPPAKVISRFPNSIQTALAAKSMVAELWVIDNSAPDRTHRLAIKFVDGALDYLSESCPEWVAPFLKAPL